MSKLSFIVCGCIGKKNNEGFWVVLNSLEIDKNPEGKEEQ